MGTLGPENPGPFPLVRPFTAEFRFGWSEIEAADARARVSYPAGIMRVEVEGGTTGLARMLWQLDASHQAEIAPDGLRPVYFTQFERYTKKAVRTEAAFKEDGLWRLRQVTPDPKNVARWKRIKLKPIRDIVSAMFFIRSQELRDGDRVRLIAFPGDSPFLVEAEVLGRETVRVGGVPRNAIKLAFELQRIDTKHENQLEPHGKFRNGTVWLSDDENRLPLRAEVNIFVGYVFGELVSVKFD